MLTKAGRIPLHPLELFFYTEIQIIFGPQRSECSFTYLLRMTELLLVVSNLFCFSSLLSPIRLEVQP